MFSLIQEAEKLLESHPGGKKDPEALAEWQQLASAMMVASDNHATVDQKANGAVDWAVMLYRSRAPKGYTFEHLRTIIAGELYSLRIALQILQAARRPRPTAQATRTRTRKSPHK
jgi:hypothetical protein